MSLLKEIDAHATVAWSPVAKKSNILAYASKEGVGVGFDNYGGELSLNSMDFSNVQPTTRRLGSVKTSSRFLALAWSETSKHVSTCPYGIIAGGMADGLVNLWNPAAILSGKGAESSLVGQIKRHTGPVNALAFNPHHDSSHLLASGGSDSDVYIMSLENLASPGVFSPGAPSAGKHTAEVSCVSWNSQVSYILATGSVNGSTMIWDLKQKKPWCELRDPLRGPVSAVAWNPNEGLHLITASGDDQRPVLRLWDLRSSTSTPLAELNEHTAGILSVSWCPNDPGLLLSCAKDNKTLLWDLFSGKSIYEFPSNQAASAASTQAPASGVFFAGAAGGQRRFDVQWSKKIPAVASTSSFDGKVQVWGLTGAGTNATRAPKWCQRPISGTFGFGGKLVSISNSALNPPSQYQRQQQPQGPAKLVHLHKVISEPQVIDNAERLEAALQTRDFKGYCEQKVKSATSTEDRHIWLFMQILFQADARQQLLLHLGFDGDNIAAEVAKYTGKKLPVVSETAPLSETSPPASSAPAATPPKSFISTSSNNDGLSADDIFSSSSARIGDDEQEVTEAVSEEASLISSMNDVAFTNEKDVQDTSRRIQGGPVPVYTEDAENYIRQSLLVGNFSAAVDCCLKNNQLAEALLLATCGGADLWTETQNIFFQKHQSPFMRTVKAIIKNELNALVEESDLSQWQETLAILSTYGKSEEFPPLCSELALRLEQAGEHTSAALCYMCADNVDRTVSLWAQRAKEDARRIGTTAALQQLIEKISVFTQSVDRSDQGVSPVVAEQFSAYAQVIANQGNLALAGRYCTQDAKSSAIMRDRLYHAAPTPGMHPPPFPFTEDVQQPQQYQQPQPQQQQQPQPQQYQQQQPQPQQYQQQQPQPQQQQQPQPQQYQQQQPQPQQQQQQPGGYGVPAALPQQPEAGYGQQYQPHQQGYQQPAAYGRAASNSFSSGQPQQYTPPAASQTAYPSQPQYGSTAPAQPQYPQQPQQFPQAPAGQMGYAPQPQMMVQQSTGVNSVAQASKNSNRVNTAPVNLKQQQSDGFVSSVGNTELTQKYGNASPAAASTAPSQAATPKAPVVLGSTDKVSPQDMAIVNGFNAAVQLLDTAPLAGGERRQLTEVKKAKDVLFTKLNEGELSSSVVEKLHEMTQQLSQRDFKSAQQLHVGLTTSDWAQHKDWLRGVKALITISMRRLM